MILHVPCNQITQITTTNYNCTQSLRDQYHDLKVRYETLEQQARVLALEKEEFSREV